MMVKEIFCNKCGGSLKHISGRLHGLIDTIAYITQSPALFKEIKFSLCERCVSDLISSFKIPLDSSTSKEITSPVSYSLEYMQIPGSQDKPKKNSILVSRPPDNIKKISIAGMSEQEAIKQLKNESIEFRVVERDDVMVLITRDHKPARYNLFIKDGIVVKVNYG